MRKRTTKTLLLWFGTLPADLQRVIMTDAVRRRYLTESQERRDGERPAPDGIGARQLEALIAAIAAKRALFDVDRLKNRNARAAQELADRLKSHRQPRTAEKSEFITSHIREFIQLRRRGVSIRALQRHILNRYGVAVSVGTLHMALEELTPNVGTPQ